MTLFSRADDPWSHRTRIVLAEKSIHVETIDVQGGRITGIEIFPWGIPRPDILHIRVAQELDVLPQVRG